MQYTIIGVFYVYDGLWAVNKKLFQGIELSEQELALKEVDN